MQIYLNGKLVPQAEAMISVFDHGLLYGDGVFEGIRIYNGRVFLLREHVVRLYDSARAIALEPPISRDDMGAAVVATCRANGLRNGYVRLLLTRGVGNLGLNPDQCGKPQVIIIAANIQLYPPALYETGLRMVTAGTIRNHPEALNPRIKSLNYLNNILAKIEAINAGVAEALMLNVAGRVAEASGDNIFVVRERALRTPPACEGCLEGLTRNAVIRLAREHGLAVTEAPLNRYDIYTADEVFLTGTAAELIPVIEVDRRAIGNGTPGAVTRELIGWFRACAAGEVCGTPIDPDGSAEAVDS